MHPSRTLRASHGGAKPSVTGFDMKKLLAASKTPRYDPWERRETWRYQGRFSRFNRYRGALPGFGIASVAFAAYCTYEYFFLAPKHHGEGHGDGHH
ncbi:hypothetical protein GQ53DRAFT_224005 [Thozetella sp. PMI_491]|nr:hypothetical protein GQ53DRAFT_224005 [Thozetella sp. PMI_491]